MNKITFNQLKNCTRAKIGVFTSNTTNIFIPKYHEINIIEQKCYLVKLKPTITNPGDNSVLAINWNHGSIPRNDYYKIQVIKIMSTMINVIGVAYDYINQEDINETWSGWLPIPEITFICEL